MQLTWIRFLKSEGMVHMSKMTPSQKIIIKEFTKRFFDLMEEYWNPESDSEVYWDSLTDDATALISEFQTNDTELTNYLSTLVVSFLNSREK